jgi:hypothetical protein
MKMMRSWIAVIVLILIVSYSAFWLYEASVLRTKLEEKRGVEELNSQGDVMSYDFDKLETSGYPFSIVLTLTNPKARFTLATEHLNFHVKCDGKVVNTFSPFGHLKKIAKDGKTHFKAAGKNPQSSFDIFADGKVSIQPKYKGHLWSALQHLSGSKNEGFEDVELLISQLQYSWDIQGKKAANGEIKEAAFHYLKKPPTQTFSLSSDFSIELLHPSLENPEINDQQDNLEPFFAILKKAAEKEEKVRTNISFDVQTEMPDFDTLKQLSIFSILIGPIPKFSIDVKKFKVDSKLASFEKSGYFTLTEDSNKKVSLELEGKAQAQYTELYYNQLIKLVDDTAKQVAVELKPENDDLKRIITLFQKHVDAVKALVPKLQQFGPFIWSAKGFFDLDRNTQNFAVGISPWNFSTDLYGVNFNLNAKREPTNTICQANIDCIKYKDLIRDFIDYFNRFTVVFNILKNEDTPKLNMFSKELQEKIIEFLVDISDTKQMNAQDLSVTFKYENGEVRIGTLTYEQFLANVSALSTMIKQEVYPSPQQLPPQKNQKK